MDQLSHITLNTLAHNKLQFATADKTESKSTKGQFWIQIVGSLIKLVYSNATINTVLPQPLNKRSDFPEGNGRPLTSPNVNNLMWQCRGFWPISLKSRGHYQHPALPDLQPWPQCKTDVNERRALVRTVLLCVTGRTAELRTRLRDPP